ncbi:MAG: PDZ domain-containing protein [Lentisphaerae bacterium]|nr:PDZ domain-containing protein [Lentisphaerota bacterium]MBT5605102.1 PDZ domain-containing protein [Lentisphaerota bacterium]MBT7055984.1 PDZ domain-containing protein [Lentisphaerota bacterium]MBT7848137.1 PDZ domain-containing protein [Lentisphaerota bacterium]
MPSGLQTTLTLVPSLELGPFGVDARPLSLAIPTPPPGYAGLYVVDLAKELFQELGIEDRQAVDVLDVRRKSPAAEAGLLEGDVIVSCQGRPMTDAKTFNGMIPELSPGTVITLEILRSRERLQIEIKLGAMR